MVVAVVVVVVVVTLAVVVVAVVLVAVVEAVVVVPQLGFLMVKVVNIGVAAARQDGAHVKPFGNRHVAVERVNDRTQVRVVWS